MGANLDAADRADSMLRMLGCMGACEITNRTMRPLKFVCQHVTASGTCFAGIGVCVRVEIMRLSHGAKGTAVFGFAVRLKHSGMVAIVITDGT